LDFLRDAGLPVGCYANRYMRHIDAAGKPMEKTFGLSYWHSLADMERWAEAHPTHVEIFGAFMRIVQELNFDLKLRLYHEVAVLQAADQEYEYINCHPRTGLLNGVAVRADSARPISIPKAAIHCAAVSDSQHHHVAES
jgi:aldoxime dehydratase